MATVPIPKQVIALAALSLILQRPAIRTRDALDAFLRAHVADGDVPAVVAMVVDRDSTLYVGAFGKASVALNRPVTPDSIFRIASMTKPVTSVAAMMLYEQGHLGLDDPVTKYLPEFSRVRVMTTWHAADATYESRPPSRMITIRDLLTHTSGLAYSFVDARLARLDDGHRTEIDLPLLDDPGKRFTYGPSTAVLGRVVETISHETLDVFFKTRIFDPLGMQDTFYSVPADKRARVVTVHARTPDGALRETPNPPALASAARGDGGLFSTAADYARFMQLILNRGRAGTRRLLKEQTVDLMTSNQIGARRISEQPSAIPAIAYPFPIGGGKDTFGFGFQIEAPPAAAGMRSVGSLSWGGIHNTHFWIDAQRSLAAVVLMQVLPYYDPRALAVLRGFEGEVYKQVNRGREENRRPQASRE
jgi:methyl acetate hydrolase